MMEIERKYLIQKEKIPFSPSDYPCRHIEQGYLCTAPVVRIRRDNDEYILTYKSKGLMVRKEYDLPLDEASYNHLKKKTDGRLIVKDRYMIPLAPVFEASSASGISSAGNDSGSEAGADADLVIELDFFKGQLAGLILAEVEFPDEASANRFVPPAWFGKDVTFSSEYHNSTLSGL